MHDVEKKSSAWEKVKGREWRRMKIVEGELKGREKKPNFSVSKISAN